MSRVSIGQQAPDFTLYATASNRQISLSELRGKYVVLFFYPQDHSPACTKEACSFRDHYSELTKSGAVVLGISSNDLASHEEFAKAFNLPFPLLADEDHAVADAYGTWKEKKMMGKLLIGNSRTTYLIDPEGVIAKIYENVKVVGHVETLQADLNALIATGN
ncbi:peroxiredoxin [Paenibacillus sp.]|jgi:peroxiredoxin Q/BCP|uniref:peroxiredoxin n=1 Tax=Paenibacillus sp. TaxID=58172 RepID=UPI002828AEAE|nr:peroxiredoxin [Paenibacillus sp.]MDR0267476.1 peroxiredoxin [Paenibacillus sp.]